MFELRLLQVQLSKLRLWLKLDRLKLDRRQLRRFAPAIGAVVAAVFVLHLGAWLWLAHTGRARIQLYLARHSDVITAKRIGTSGYPFHVEIRLEDVSATSPAFKVSAPEARVRLGFVALGWFAVTAPEGATLVVRGVEAKAGEAKLYLTGGEDTGSVELKLAGCEIGNAMAAKTVDLSVTLPSAPPPTANGETARFALEIADAAPAGQYGELGRTIETMDFEGTVSGKIAGNGRTALSAWRDAGGTVEFHRLDLKWGHFTVAGSGTLALDKDLQPEAAFTAIVDGWPSLLDGLAADGAMSASQASILKLGLTLISPPDADAAMKVPITVQNGHLYLEKAKILRVPRIDWPDA